ncbi:MAG TPA: ATP-binding cassette domain-containing protein [Candidatus Aphodoplasma excrementigallinarum]|uniref:ATP-binding cassette domain-containing protein n=1 Tax=Candidatus Aphodoplasma excrementigallinarum TaxID=2840673 RepID=A0A9D1NHT3_9FIRM|nr:ATP-binding cassette domain-containing protein [Candidatus Aphodoplasma excrementigallinarum]
MERENPIIRFRGLGKTFHTKNGEVTALRGIEFDIHAGEIFGIIGMSGAGKSTLVRCINFLERPTEGTVIFDGKDMGSLRPKELRQTRRSMGMIFQQFNLLMQKTAFDNVCFPMQIAGVPKAEAHARAAELLRVVGLEERAQSYPAQLSGGQKQRVAIARALATNPKVLLCDEATSALDPTTTTSILALLKDINQRMGITIVVITHEMSVVEEICSRVAIIDDSRIAEIGKIEDIFASPKSEAARRLVFHDTKSVEHFTGKRCIRIVFDGRSSFEPVVSNMVMECKVPVNIMFADLKDIDGKAAGQLVLQLPDEETGAAKVKNYLAGHGLNVEEVGGYV